MSFCFRFFGVIHSWVMWEPCLTSEEPELGVLHSLAKVFSEAKEAMTLCIGVLDFQNQDPLLFRPTSKCYYWVHAGEFYMWDTKVKEWRSSFQKSCWFSSHSDDYIGFITRYEGCVPSKLVCLWVRSAVCTGVAGSVPPSEKWKTVCWVCSACCAFFLTVSEY